MNIPDDLRYTKDHEWVRLDADGVATIGITDYAQSELGDIVFVRVDDAGTHVDAFSHMARQYRDQSIDTMPLSMFYTEGICLDLSHKGPGELIEAAELWQALDAAGLAIAPGDTVLLYTDHYRRTYGTPAWENGPGLSAAAATWLGKQEIAAFGVEPVAPGVRHVSNRQVHHICGALGFTHYECLVNLHQLIGRGRFRFVGLPLKIRSGTGSPVRAVAIFET